MERFAFYDRLQPPAFVPVGELQPCANFVFEKGLIGESLVH